MTTTDQLATAAEEVVSHYFEHPGQDVLEFERRLDALNTILAAYNSAQKAEGSAASSAQEPLTDSEIEAVCEKHGARWNGDHWVIEDADLHPLIRSFAAPARLAGATQGEAEKHATRGRTWVKRLYNDPPSSIPLVEVGAWIEYAAQLLTIHPQAPAATQPEPGAVAAEAGQGEREAFEAELRDKEEWGRYSFGRFKDGDYKSLQTAFAWSVWQARALAASAPSQGMSAVQMESLTPARR